jgi:haloalkane dehalogenase
VQLLRTPDEHFDGLPDYPFASRYVTVDDGEGGPVRVHVVDEGDPGAPIVVLLHGEPSWSYLYRTMIPVLVDAGLRCVAPDLVGFGRSDKPVSPADYTYARHVEWMRAALFDECGLQDVTLFGQDWGSLIGLRLVGEHPDRFSRVAIGNGFLPTGDFPMPEAFVSWQTYARTAVEFPIGRIVSRGCVRELPDDVVAAYDAPFPDDTFKAGARQFPTLVPTTPDDPASAPNRAAWEVLRSFTRPFLTTFGDSDPITAGADRLLQGLIPGAAGQPHVTLAGAGHFLQEDVGPELAGVLAAWVNAS